MITIDKNIITQVIQYTGITEAKYLETVQATALDYLKHYMPAYPAVHGEVVRSKTFWNWWKLHWEKRDAEFIESCEEEWRSHADGLERWQCMHDAIVLASAVYLSGQVLHETYAAMIGELMTNQTKHHFTTI